MKVTEYGIVESDGIEQLIVKMNKAITNGWQPWGDIHEMDCQSSSGRKYHLCCHVIVKYEE